MTAVESQNNNSLMRPTDLSLKGCLNNKYSKESSNSPSPNSVPMPLINEHKVPFVGESQQQWRNKIKAEPVTMQSPMTLTYATAGVASSMAPTMPIDSVTSLVMLESLLSQYHRYSPPAVFDPRTVQTMQRSRMGSDSSNEKVPISQPILDAAKGLTELQHSGIHNDKRFVHNSNHTSNNDTFCASTTGKFKTCKRKGGWKFHDFSDESEAPGKRKRTYCHNRLETDIMQLYQDRVNVKEVPTITNSSKAADRLVIIEPSQIVDADLIRYNTSLRIVLDKKKMIYRLQVLPHTIEEGPLSNKTQVLHAVSKMLGQTGAVLCPGIVHARLSSVYDDCNSWSAGRLQNKRSDNRAVASKRKMLVTSDSSSEGEMNFNSDKYRNSWKILRNSVEHSARSLTPPENASGSCSTVTSSGKLPTSHSENVLSKLMTLNKEVSESQRHTSVVRNKNQNNSTDCLLWHVPTPGGKIKKGTWPEEAKWCRNCLRKMRGSSKRAEYPRVSST